MKIDKLPTCHRNDESIVVIALRQKPPKILFVEVNEHVRSTVDPISKECTLRKRRSQIWVFFAVSFFAQNFKKPLFIFNASSSVNDPN